MTATAAPPRPACELRCLGTVSLAGQGGRLVPRTRKQIALLLYMARRPGKAFARDELIELLWSEDAAKGSRHSLSHAASLVNKTMGGEFLRSVGNDRLVLAPGAVWLDVVEFERLAADGRHDEALELWRGQLFEGTWIRRAPNFEQWLGGERDRLHRIFRRIAHGRLEDLRNSGSHVAMREEAERLLELDPLDEKAMLVHLEALTLMDDRSLALRRYREFEKRLRHDLDAEPGSALKSWVKRLRRSDGDMGFGRSAPLPRISEVTVLPTPQPLFGRTEEFAQLWTAWEQAQRGKGSFIILEGEAGIGKTALATKLVNQAHVAGGSVCYVKCYKTEKSVPFAPVTALIRQLSRLPGFVALDPVWIGELTRLVPELRERFPNAPQPMAVDDAARLRLSDATVSAAFAVADEHALLVSVDDLHSADEASLALLHYLARRANEVALFLLGSARTTTQLSESEKTFFDTTKSIGFGRFMSLRPLPVEELDRIAHAVLAKRGIGPETPGLGRIASLASGNPLRAIEAALSFELHGKNAVRVDTVAANGLSQADNFDRTASERLLLLSGPSQLVISTIALAGRPLTEYELAMTTALAPPALAVATAGLEAAHFVRRDGPTLVIKHERYAASASEAIGEPMKRRIHLRLARLLASTAGGNPSSACEVARHFAMAGKPVLARAHALAAANYARSMGAVRAMADALEIASAHSGPELERINSELAGCYLHLADNKRLEALCAQARQLSGSEQFRREMLYFEIVGGMDSGTSDIAECVEKLASMLKEGPRFRHYEDAHTLLMRAADKTGSYHLVRWAKRRLRSDSREGRGGRAHALFASGYFAAKYFWPRRAIPLFQRAAEVAEAERQWSLWQMSGDFLAIALKQVGRFEESIHQFNQSLALARMTMSPYSEKRCLQNRAVSEMALGDAERAVSTLDLAEALDGDSTNSGYIQYNRAVIAFYEGSLDSALGRLSSTLDYARSFNLHSLACDCCAMVAIVQQRLGNLAQLETATNLLNAMETTSDSVGLMRLNWAATSARAWHRALILGDVDGALISLSRKSRQMSRRDVPLWLAIEYESLLLRELHRGGRDNEGRARLRDLANTFGAAAIGRLATE